MNFKKVLFQCVLVDRIMTAKSSVNENNRDNWYKCCGKNITDTTVYSTEQTEPVELE